MNEQAPSIWTTCYAPSGLKFSLTVTLDTDIQALVAKALELDALMAASGLLPREAGLEPGQKRETVTHLIRCQQKNDDGSKTWVAVMYQEGLEYKVIHVYMNNSMKIDALVNAAGLQSFEQIPAFEKIGKSYPDFGDIADRTLAVKPFEIVTFQPPKKDGEQLPPKKELVSYVGQAPIVSSPSAPAQQQSASTTVDVDKLVIWYRDTFNEPDAELSTIENLLGGDFSEWGSWNKAEIVKAINDAHFELMAFLAAEEAPAQPKRDLPGPVISELKSHSKIKPFQDALSGPEVVNIIKAVYRENPELKPVANDAFVALVAERCQDHVERKQAQADKKAKLATL